MKPATEIHLDSIMRFVEKVEGSWFGLGRNSYTGELYACIGLTDGAEPIVDYTGCPFEQGIAGCYDSLEWLEQVVEENDL